MIRKEISDLTKQSIKTVIKKGNLPDFDIPEVLVEIPRDLKYGDYSTNIALLIAGKTNKNPAQLAKEIVPNFPETKIFKKIEAVGGFINFFLSEDYLQKQVAIILKEKDRFGNLKIGKNQKVNIEFISANPTGPLTLGNGRGGFCGDVLANVLEKAGYKETREYYINNRGEQIIKLGHSVLGDKQAVYKGEYVEKLRKAVSGNDAEQIGKKAAKIILDKMIKPSTKKMGVKFDKWFSEKELYKKKEAEKVLSELKKNNLTYEKEGALWFKSTQFGDDKDRVLIKGNGDETYITSDIAYLKNKFKRGFEKLIFFWGADHYGYVNRLKASAEALGYRREDINIIVMQLVRLFEGGKEVRMSKRTGNYITIDELIDEVGLDATRFFFLVKSADTHFNFDMDLAREQSNKNPVYYVQYAHARTSSILTKIKSQNSKLKAVNPSLILLSDSNELNLIKQLARLPEIIKDTAKDYQVQRLPQYAIDLADAFHKFYENCRVITDDKKLSEARLALVLAAKIVLKNTLDLMGISAPEKM
jgi:arginyl-tRNA synthetase